jgi:hypothetical protein
MDIIEAINMMRRLESLPEIYSSTEKAVIKAIHAYYSELFEIEKADILYFESGEKEEGYSRKSIARKIEVHKRYWSNHALFYEPCSLSSDPKHDWSRVSEIEILRNDDDDNQLFLFTAKYKSTSGTKLNLSYLLKTINGNLFIEHSFM